MTDLTALIERLEAATEPDRLLDRAIGEAVGAPLGLNGDVRGLGYALFTCSIDDALTLVPKGWSLWRIDQYHEDKNPAWGWGVTLRCHARPDIGVNVGESRTSLPLAICLAALKARAAQEPR